MVSILTRSPTPSRADAAPTVAPRRMTTCLRDRGPAGAGAVWAACEFRENAGHSGREYFVKVMPGLLPVATAGANGMKLSPPCARRAGVTPGNPGDLSGCRCLTACLVVSTQASEEQMEETPASFTFRVTEGMYGKVASTGSWLYSQRTLLRCHKEQSRWSVALQRAHHVGLQKHLLDSYLVLSYRPTPQGRRAPRVSRAGFTVLVRDSPRRRGGHGHSVP